MRQRQWLLKDNEAGSGLTGQVSKQTASQKEVKTTIHLHMQMPSMSKKRHKLSNRHEPYRSPTRTQKVHREIAWSKVTSWRGYYKNWEEVQWQGTLGRNLTCCSSLIDSSILVRLLSCKIFTNLLCLREQHNRQRDQVMRHTSQTMNVYQTRTIKTLRVEHDKRLLLGHHLRMKEKRPDKETPFI